MSKLDEIRARHKSIASISLIDRIAAEVETWSLHSDPYHGMCADRITAILTETENKDG